MYCHSISQSIIHYHPQQMSLRLDTEGLRKRMVAVRSEGGRVEVDSGGTIVTKSGARMT
jgi:hypothetical protein